MWGINNKSKQLRGKKFLQGKPAVWKYLSAQKAAVPVSYTCKWIFSFPYAECPQVYLGNVTVKKFTLAL